MERGLGRRKSPSEAWRERKSMAHLRSCCCALSKLPPKRGKRRAVTHLERLPPKRGERERSDRDGRRSPFTSFEAADRRLPYILTEMAADRRLLLSKSQIAVYHMWREREVTGMAADRRLLLSKPQIAVYHMS